MLFVRRYTVATVPTQCDFGVPTNEVILQSSTGGVTYVSSSYNNALSSTLRYGLPLGRESKFKVSNLNLLWFTATATGNTLDIMGEIKDAS